MMCWTQVTAWRAARFASEAALRQQVVWVERLQPNETFGFIPAITSEPRPDKAPGFHPGYKSLRVQRGKKIGPYGPKKYSHLEEFVYSTCDWYSSVRASPRR